MGSYEVWEVDLEGGGRRLFSIGWDGMGCVDVGESERRGVEVWRQSDVARRRNNVMGGDKGMYVRGRLLGEIGLLI